MINRRKIIFVENLIYEHYLDRRYARTHHQIHGR